MSDDDMRKVGFAIPQDTLDELDDVKRRWDRHEARTISRSEIAREALAVGVDALEMLDDEYSRGLTTHARRATVRQALIDHFERERNDDESDDQDV